MISTSAHAAHLRRTRPKSLVRSACCCCCCAPSSTLVADASPVAACCVDLHCLPTVEIGSAVQDNSVRQGFRASLRLLLSLVCRWANVGEKRVRESLSWGRFQPARGKSTVQPHNETRWQEGNKYRLQVHGDIVQQLRSSSSIRQATHRRQVLHGMREVAASKGRAEVSSAAARQRHTSH